MPHPPWKAHCFEHSVVSEKLLDASRVLWDEVEAKWSVCKCQFPMYSDTSTSHRVMPNNVSCRSKSLTAISLDMSAISLDLSIRSLMSSDHIRSLMSSDVNVLQTEEVSPIGEDLKDLAAPEASRSEHRVLEWDHDAIVHPWGAYMLLLMLLGSPWLVWRLAKLQQHCKLG